MPPNYKVCPWDPYFDPKKLGSVVSSMVEDNVLGEEHANAAKVLISAMVVGIGNMWRIADFSGVPIREIKKYNKNLRNNGLWIGKHEISYSDWEESGDVGFVLDILIAIGRIDRQGGQRYAVSKFSHAVS